MYCHVDLLTIFCRYIHLSLEFPFYKKKSVFTFKYMCKGRLRARRYQFKEFCKQRNK